MLKGDKEASPAAEILDEVDDDMKFQLKDFFDEKVRGGKSVWGMTIETLGMAEGGQKSKDIITPTLEKGMKVMQTMLKVARSGENKDMWKLDLVPIDHFNATLNDVLRAFVMWSRKEEETTYNISKAFRRLQSYAAWMKEHRDDLKEPFTMKGVRRAAEAWKMQLTHDSKGRVVWWVDIAAWDLAGIKKDIPPRESLRYVFYMCHIVILDPKAQENGIIIVQSLGEKGMIESFTMVPMDLGTQMDRLTIGVLPIRTKMVYTYNHLRWVSILLTFFKPFMSAKMRQRIVVIPRKEDPAAVIGKEVGANCIPVGLVDLKGNLKKDLLEEFFEKRGLDEELDKEEEEGLEC